MALASAITAENASDGGIQPDRVEPGNICRCCGEQLPNACPCERDAEGCADRREHERLGEHLPDDANAAGSKGGAEGELRFP